MPGFSQSQGLLDSPFWCARCVRASSSSTTPRPGSRGHLQQPVGIRHHRLGEHEVTPRRRPAGRIVGELQKRAAADAGAHMQVGEQADPVGPGVRGEPAVAPQRELARASARRRSRGPARRPAGTRRARRPQSASRSSSNVARHLAAGDPHARCSRAAPACRRILAGERLLHPQHALGAQRARPRAAHPPARGPLDVAGIRHHWLRSTRISSASPTAARTAATTAIPSSIRSRAIRTLTARKPCRTSSCASSARRAGSAARPRRRTRAARRQRRRGAPTPAVPHAWPSRSHSAASSGQ